jgi:hypothetical protein
MRTDTPSLSALAVMIEYAAIEASLLENKPLEFILRAALKEAKRSLETIDDGHSETRRIN